MNSLAALLIEMPEFQNKETVPCYKGLWMGKAVFQKEPTGHGILSNHCSSRSPTDRERLKLPEGR